MRRGLTAGVAVVLLLTGCATPSSADPGRGGSAAEAVVTRGAPDFPAFRHFRAFRGDDGLLSNLAVASFAAESLIDTAAVVRIEASLTTAASPERQRAESEVALPSVESWRRLWRSDADEPLWKVHVLCGAAGRDIAMAVVPEHEQRALVTEAQTFIDEFVDMTEAGDVAQVPSLIPLSAIHAIACLTGHDARRGIALTEGLFPSISRNAALTLQWKDVIETMAEAGAGNAQVHSFDRSDFLADVPPARCDDRTAVEAGAMLLLDAVDASRVAPLVRCATDALDSADMSVLPIIARVTENVGEIDHTAVRNALTRRIEAVRRDDATAVRHPSITGSLGGTLAGLKILRARGEAPRRTEGAQILAALHAASLSDAGDSLLLLHACLIVADECEGLADRALAEVRPIADGLEKRGATWESLLGTLAAVHGTAPSRVEEVVTDLRAVLDESAAGDDRCVSRQLAHFDSAARSGGWPSREVIEEARTEFIRMVEAGRLDEYCDLSWISQFGPSHPVLDGRAERPDETAHKMTFTEEGFPVIGDELAPLTVAAAAADLGFHD